MNENKLLIGRASIYNRTYYYNPEFANLPASVLEEVQQICTYYAAKLHCIFALKLRRCRHKLSRVPFRLIFHHFSSGAPSRLSSNMRRRHLLNWQKIRHENSHTKLVTTPSRENGDVYFECLPEEWDEGFDEIGAKLDLDKLARDKQDLFVSLKAWYVMTILKEDFS